MNKSNLYDAKEEKSLLQERINQLFNDPRENILLPNYQKNCIIIKPIVIWDILLLFQHFNLDEEKQSLIIQELKKYIDKFPQNSLALVTKTIKRLPNDKTENIIEYLIKLALNIADLRPNISNQLISLISLIYKYNVLKKSHLKVVFSHMSEKFYDNQITDNLLYSSVHLLQEIFMQQNPLIDEPQNFFFFSGINSYLSVSAIKQINWPFLNGFSIGIWFYLEQANEYIYKQAELKSQQRLPKLFTIHSIGNGGIEAYFVGNKLYYRILSINYSMPTNQSNGCLIAEFKPNVWHYLGLDHEKSKMFAKSSQLQIVINDQPFKTIAIEFPKINSEAPLTTFTFAENFIGKISTIMLFKNPIGQTKLTELYLFYHYGIQSNSQIKNLNITLEKHLEKILLAYIPARSVDEKCYDIFNGISGLLIGNAGFVYKDFSKLKLPFLGGLQSMIPFYYLLRFFNNSKYPNLLNIMLQMIIQLMRNKPENQNEAFKINFFKIIGQLLSENMSNFINKETVEIIAELRSCISDSHLLEEMFVDFIWKVDIYKDANQSVKNDMWAYIRTIYVQNFMIKNYQYFSLFGIQDILDLIVAKFDDKLFRCCQKHATIICLNDANYQSSNSDILDSNILEKVGPIVKIIEGILSTGGQYVTNGILAISNVFTLKCSPCLHMLLFQMLKKFVIEDSLLSIKAFIKIMLENKFIQNITYLLSSTPCMDLKAMCIKFLNILFRYPQNTISEYDSSIYLSANLCNFRGSKIAGSNEQFGPICPSNDYNDSAKKNKKQTSKNLMSMSSNIYPSRNLNKKSAENQLDFISNNLRNSASKVTGSHVFDFSKSQILEFSNPEEIKDDTKNDNLDVKLPSFKKKMNQNISKAAAIDTISNQETEYNEEKQSPDSKNLPKSDSPPVQKSKSYELDTKPKTKSNEKNYIAIEKEIIRQAPATTSSQNPQNQNYTSFTSKSGIKQRLMESVTQNQPNNHEILDTEASGEITLTNSDSEIRDYGGFKSPITKKSSSKNNSFKKRILNSAPLCLDIDVINEDFLFGGENGKIKINHIDDAMDKITREIAEMAKECVAFMSKENHEKVDDDAFHKELPIVSEFDLSNQFEEPALKLIEDIQKNTQENQKASFTQLGISGDSDVSEILEDDPKLITESSDQTITEQDKIIDNKIKSLRKCKLDENQIFNSQNDLETILTYYRLEKYDFECLYNALLEWLLHKNPESLDGTVILDDTDQIKSSNVIYIMMEFYWHADHNVKQKMISDIYMILKWNPKNCETILAISEFYPFLLEILYKQQILYYDQELKEHDLTIWEMGCKVHTLLMKYVLAYDSDCLKKFQNLFIWIENKKTSFHLHQNSFKLERATQYLIRHLYNHLLENINDLACKAIPMLPSLFWKNFISIVFLIEEIISSAHTGVITQAANLQLENQNICSLRNFFFKTNIDENYPFNFKQIFSHNEWADWKLTENLFRIFDFIWGKSITSSSGFFENLTEVEKLDNKIMNLMDTSNIDKYQRDSELYLNEPYQMIDPKRGAFLKTVIFLLIAYIEDCVKNIKLDDLKINLQRLNRIYQSSLITFEIIKDQNYLANIQGSVIANYLYIYNFLYNIIGIVANDNCKIELKNSLRRMIIFMFGLIEYLYSRANNPHNLIENKSMSSSSIILIQNSILFEMLKTYLNFSIDNLIESIKALKNKEYQDIDTMLYSKEWMYIFLDSPKVLTHIERYYGESLINMNAAVLRNIQTRESLQMEGKILNQKKREEISQKQEKEIQGSIAKIHANFGQKNKENIAYQEENVRVAKNLWKKIWKRLRVYVGNWKHPEFYDQIDKKFPSDCDDYDKMEKNKLFFHKIYKYETKTRARPFLKVKLLEPQHVIDYSNNLKANKINSMNRVHPLNTSIFLANKFQTQLDQSKAFNLADFGKNLKDTLKAFIPVGQLIQETKPLIDYLSPRQTDNKYFLIKNDSISPSMNDEIILTKKCQWIKTLTIRNGSLRVTANKLIFILEELDQKENHIAFLRHRLPDDRRIFKEWSVESIKEIQKRRYIVRKTAMELFLYDGSTLLFNFPDGDPDEIISKIIRIQKNRSQNLIFYNSPDPKKLVDKAGITKKWMMHEISNFEYLMALNSLSGRSYKDLTQYPVFPWILCDYVSEFLDLENPNVYRNLSRTMGALGSEERINNFRERFENSDPFNPVPKFFFGSHYSSPAIILQFLIRINPYTTGARELQSGKFDLPDRLFYAIEESFKGATEELSDVRELVPEFFFLPEMFINIDKLDFGIQQTKQRVHNVQLPKWSKGNPYRFVSILKQALENDCVSQFLHNWIDLIFGYKQKGKEAEKNLNTFYFLTYEDSVDLDKIIDPGLKLSTEAQIVHFGQCPSQLFLKPHPQRLKKESLYDYKFIADPKADIRAYRPANKKLIRENIDKHNWTIYTLQERAIVKLKLIHESKIAGMRKDGTITYFLWSKSTSNSGAPPFSCGVEKEKNMNIEKPKSESYFEIIDKSTLLTSYPMIFLNMAKIVVVGGFWDGRLMVSSVDTNSIIDVYFNHIDTITSIISDPKENFIITGSKSGDCILWKISPENFKLTIKFHFYDHDNTITSIFISTELKAFITSSLDGQVNLYNFENGQLIRVIYHPVNMPIHNVVITTSPLPAIIFFSNEDRLLYSYSINGRLLESINDESIHMTSCLVVKDLSFNEALIYGNEKGEIFIRELPFLTLRRKFQVSAGSPVLSIILTKDKRFLLCGCGDGEIVVLCDRNFSQQSTSNSPILLSRSSSLSYDSSMGSSSSLKNIRETNK